MADRLQLLDNYQAVAANGIGGFDDFIDVDAVPPTGDKARDTVKCIISLGTVGKTLCTGWQSTPPRLFIDPLSSANIPGPITIMSTPSVADMAQYQSRQRAGGSWAGSVLTAELGIMTKANVYGAVTVELAATSPGFDGFYGYEQAFLAPGRTVLVLTDANTNQPTLTWGTIYDIIKWEAGAPQFAVGKPYLLVAIEATGDGLTFGWFKQFA